MKKYLFGLIATVFAVSLVAFTTPKKSQDTKTYRYELNSLSGAATPSNWTEVSIEPSCSGSGVPCRVTFETSQFADIEAFINGRSDLQVLQDELVVQKPE